MKVIVGMSGGVDSSVTAYLLREQGYEVIGLSLILMEMRGGSACQSLCCSVQAIDDAAEVAAKIGIPHKRLDLRAEFLEFVIEPFIKAYSEGLTPNPCILCNRFIKFPYLFKEAETCQAEFVSTGHYAISENGLLRKGIDQKKDQSYVLYMLRKEEVKRLLLPLGRRRKAEVRAIAKKAQLPVFDRPESQEICFVGGENYSDFIKNIEPPRSGPIFDLRGNLLGTHRGIQFYTIGQRKALGISAPEPLYVVDISTERNALIVGPKMAAYKREFIVGDLNWLIEKPDVFEADVKVRSQMKAEPATLRVEADKVRVIFKEPQWAPAPGQSAVFYDADIVIGGGVIEKVIG